MTEEALDTFRPLMEGAHPSTLRVLIQLGELLHQQGRLDEAEARLAEATRFGSALDESPKRQEGVRLRQEAERLDMEVTSRPSVRGSPN